MRALPKYSLGELLVCESSVTKTKGKVQLAGHVANGTMIQRSSSGDG